MSLADQMATVFSRIPLDLQAPITFRNAAGQTSSSVAMEGSDQSAADSGFRDAQMTLEGEREVWVRGSGLTFAPKPGMTATWGGVTLNIAHVDPIGPEGTAVHYKVRLQK